jgi:hypothetical protein
MSLKTLNQLAFIRRDTALNFKESRQEFLSIYPNRVQGILRPPGCKSWVTVSKHFPISDDTVIGAVAGTESNTWGLRFGEKTLFAVFDIDSKSRYHNAQELQRLSSALAEVELEASIFQSSDSGGWHLYLFLADWENSDEVQTTLKSWLRANSYEIKNGTLEVFPSGMGLRLPLQSGFAWLDGSGNVVKRREELTADEAISRFVTDLRTRASNWQDVKARIESQLNERDRSAGGDAQAHEKAIEIEGFDRLWNYGLIAERYRDGRRYWQEGLTASGQRHDAILAVEHYLWHGDESAGIPALPGTAHDQTRIALIKAWIEKKHNGFCNHIRRGNLRKVHAQITRACLWRRSAEFQRIETYPMTDRLIERLIELYKSTGRIWSIEDLKKGNEGRSEKARTKIRAAVDHLRSQGQRIGLRPLMRLTGCHQHTLERHADLWRDDLLAGVAGEKNPFLGLDLNRGGSGTGAVRKEEDFDPELAAPPLVLPGSEPTSESPESSPRPSGCVARLDSGSSIRRYSGRGSERAGGANLLLTPPLFSCGDAQNLNIRAFEADIPHKTPPIIQSGDAQNSNIPSVPNFGERPLSCLTRECCGLLAVRVRSRVARCCDRGPPGWE